MSLVLDCSLALAWFFEDESTAETDALMARAGVQGVVVPALWWLEVANGFQMAVRRQRVTRDYRDASLATLASLAIETESGDERRLWAALLPLADRHRLTAYDAAYLELAMRRDLPLATLDRALRAAAQEERVELLG